MDDISVLHALILYKSTLSPIKQGSKISLMRKYKVMQKEVPDQWELPIEPNDLPLFDPRPASGIMAKWIGHQYTEEEVWHFRQYNQDIYPDEEAELRPRAARIRAFDIPSFANFPIVITQLDHLSESLIDVLATKFPNWEWNNHYEQGERSHLLGPLKKYGIFTQPFMHLMRKPLNSQWFSNW
jgi:hypothetical protein